MKLNDMQAIQRGINRMQTRPRTPSKPSPYVRRIATRQGLAQGGLQGAKMGALYARIPLDVNAKKPDFSKIVGKIKEQMKPKLKVAPYNSKGKNYNPQ